MPDSPSLPDFRPLAHKLPDAECVRKPDGTVYLKQRHAPGDRPFTVPHCLAERAEAHPERPWMKQRHPQTDEWMTLTYGNGNAQSRSMAQALLDLGAGPESPVMMLSGNSIELGVMMMASMTIGAPATPISVPYSLMSTDFAKLKHCFEAVKPKVLFVQLLEPFKRALEALGDHGCAVISVEPPSDGSVLSFGDLIQTPTTPAVDTAQATLNDDSVAKYLFTSGSTGMPKPVPQTQGAMCSMIAGVEGLRDDSQDPDLDPNRIDNMLDWLPWNHISGSNVNFNLAIWNGATYWIDDGKPTDALFGRTMRNLRDCKPSTFGTAPIALGKLAEAMEDDVTLRDAFFENMRTVSYGGATLSDDVYDRLQNQAIAATGRRIPILTMYGATETQGITSVHWKVERVGLIGLPLAGLTLKLVPTSGKLEVRIKGPTVMPGYLNMPDKNAEVFDEEGFYCLGDAAVFVDEEDPNQGIVFDGRVGEDFKLVSGTWVSVGVLRPDLVAACSPLVFDAIICGQDKNFISAMIWPAPAAFESLVEEHAGDQAKAFSVLRDALQEKIAAFNASEPGSSRRIKRFVVLTDPPNIDVGEITDKGYVNQRKTQENRHEQYDALFAEPPGPGVIVV